MDNKLEKYLPLGSVVLLKKATKRIMIIGYAIKSQESGEKIWDYVGCLYPEGVITPDKNLLFDHDGIEKVFSLGYADEEQKKFSEEIKSKGLDSQNVSKSSDKENELQPTIVESTPEEQKNQEQATDIKSFDPIAEKTGMPSIDKVIDFSKEPLTTFKPNFPPIVEKSPYEQYRKTDTK